MNDIQSWLEKRRFHHSQFRDLKNLMELKEKMGTTISLCFPTLNEESTIGKSIIICKAELMDRYPLIDEIAVIDSGSTDRTCEIAQEFGAATYSAAEHLPEEGFYKGKGENLWKALYLLKGDIIVYIDADIRNIHHRFAYGLIGPLLTHSDIKFVKAFYKRPVVSAKGLHASGGGRVTEILVRPLFSQFFPDLAALIQPLSGEYAGYRSIFEQIPFPIGYGVETGMLIDIFQKWGLDIIAQTDLDQRVHRNQSIISLGKMSFGILQTFWNRLKKYKGIEGIDPESFALRQIITHGLNPPEMSEIKIEEMERKPIIEVENYVKKMQELKK
ncbi:MAG: glucosyl-3-phosphoglycerate synthase [Spirochaetales bacterium]|nr:glucosyl-3-phosphoglycerate synthase [Spirochaetales bacterium]